MATKAPSPQAWVSRTLREAFCKHKGWVRDAAITTNFCPNCGGGKDKGHTSGCAMGRKGRAADIKRFRARWKEAISLCPYEYRECWPLHHVMPFNIKPTARQNPWTWFVINYFFQDCGGVDLLWGSNRRRFMPENRKSLDEREMFDALMSRLTRGKRYLAAATVRKACKRYWKVDTLFRKESRLSGAFWINGRHGWDPDYFSGARWGTYAEGPFTPIDLKSCEPALPIEQCVFCKKDSIVPYVSPSLEVGGDYRFHVCRETKYTSKKTIRKSWFPSHWRSEPRYSGSVVALADDWRDEEEVAAATEFVQAHFDHLNNANYGREENRKVEVVAVPMTRRSGNVCNDSLCQSMADWHEGRPKTLTDDESLQIPLRRPAKRTLKKYPKEMWPLIRSIRYLEYETKYQRKVQVE